MEMLELYVIQARYGDCLLLKYGEKKPNYILIDGGPSGNHEEFIVPALQNVMKESSCLETVIISHIDNDHIQGIDELLADVKYQKDSNEPPSVSINELWINSFRKTVDTGDLEKRMKQVQSVAGSMGIQMQATGNIFNGVRQGQSVLLNARMLKIPVNPDTDNEVFLVQDKKQIIQKDNIEITVVGPTTENLEKLQKKWQKWVEKNEKKIRDGEYTAKFAAMQDRSIPNLSSLILLVKSENKSILLTGDCRGDHLQQGLIKTGLSKDGRFHVDILKVPHHGSKRNVSRDFFEEVTSDTYILSANGKHGNPDYETLVWIVETAKEAGRKIKLIFTNETESTQKLLQNYPETEWNYETEFMPEGETHLLVK